MIGSASRHANPHYLQSNGYEVAIKKVKLLILKTAPNRNIDSEEFHHDILEVHNTPNFTGQSPAQELFASSFLCAWPL